MVQMRFAEFRCGRTSIETIPSPALANTIERTAREYFGRSLTVLWPRIIMAKNDKKNI